MKSAFPYVLSLLAVLPASAGAEQTRFGSDEAAAEFGAERHPWHPVNLLHVLGDERGRKWDLAGRGIAVRPDGKQLAVGGFGGVIYVMDAATLRLTRVLRGDASFIKSVHYAPAANGVISVGSNMSVQLWKVDGGDAIEPTTLASLGNISSCAAWSADGSTLVIRDQRIHVWRRAEDGKFAKLAAIAEEKPDQSVPEEIRHVADTLGSRGMAFLKQPIVAVSADGTLIAATLGGGIAGIQLDEGSVTATATSSVTVWRIDGATAHRQWTIDGIGYVGALAFSPGGRALAIGTHDHKVHLFDIAGELPRLRLVRPLNAAVRALCYDPRGETLAVAAESIQLWDVSQEPPALTGESPLAYNMTMESNQMAFSPDGSTFFYVDGSVVRRWPLERAAPEPAGEEEASFSGVHSLDFTPDGRRLVAAIKKGGDGGVMVWDLTSHTASLALRTTFRDCGTDDVAISPDGKTFVFTVSRHPEYRLELWRLADRDIGRLAGVDLRAGHRGSFWCAAFSPDGSTLATGHRDGLIRTWDVGDGQLTRVGKPAQADDGGVGGLAYSSDGRTLASVDWAGGVILWNRDADGLRRKARLGNHSSRAYAVRFSPDGRLLASGDYSGVIKLWNLSAEDPSAVKLHAHTSNITSLDFAPDGRTLLSAGGDGRVVVWELPAAKPRQQWRFPGYVNSAKFDPSGEIIFSANGNGTIYAWRP